MKKLICYTLDLEPDFGGRVKSYSSLENISNFLDVIRENRINLTTFAAGHLFQKKRNVIKKLIDAGSEIELHSYSHNLAYQDEEHEIKKSKKAYIKHFGKKPIGYRSPKGMITKKGLSILSREEFKYDSSIYPTILLGRYNNLKYPAHPFYFSEYRLMELPFSVIPKIRLPLAMGYLQPFGLDVSRKIINIFGLPNLIVFDFHMWNLYKPSETNKLPLKWKVLLANNLDNGMKMFQNLIKVFDERGYKPITMGELYLLAKEQLAKGNLTKL